MLLLLLLQLLILHVKLSLRHEQGVHLLEMLPNRHLLIAQHSGRIQHRGKSLRDEIHRGTSGLRRHGAISVQTVATCCQKNLIQCGS